MSDGKRLETLLRHVNNVQENCLRLGEILIEKGQEDFGLRLIANGRLHDNSKFIGIEWEYFHPDVKEEKPELFRAAWLQHVKTNPHHPEYWSDGIKGMHDIYIAEMVCDWKSRSEEFGTDFLGWIKEEATERFNFNVSCKVYKKIKEYTDLLIEPAFK